MSNDIRQTDLFKAMWLSGNYNEESDVIETIEEMRQEVAEGRDPEEVLYEEGFEPDYLYDLITLS